MARRSYDHYCGIARALDLVGERWALLVVRELLPGPKRYSDLLDGLPGISTNVLASRLSELEEAGLVRRTRLPPPAASAVYELTATGRELEEPILALGRWGGRMLGAPGGREFRPGWGLLALQASFRPEHAARLTGPYEMRIDGSVFSIALEDGRPVLREGGARDPRLVVETDSGTFLELGYGSLAPADAVAEGRVALTGPRRELAQLFTAFRFPAADPPRDAAV